MNSVLVGTAILELDIASKHDGYVISKHSAGYTVRLRGAVGAGKNLCEAIGDAIDKDSRQEEELDRELANYSIDKSWHTDVNGS